MLTGALRRFLNIGRQPGRCDCIFVLAGRQERKVFGIELWRRGFAPELILSTGRFEWRSFYTLGLPDDGGLKSLVDATPPVQRHFFVRLRPSGAETVLIRKSRLGTMTEARELAAFLKGCPIRSLMVVSSPIHMRRVALAFRHALRGTGISLSFVAVPEDQDAFIGRDIRQEFIKYLGYRILLAFTPRRRNVLR